MILTFSAIILVIGIVLVIITDFGDTLHFLGVLSIVFSIIFGFCIFGISISTNVKDTKVCNYPYTKSLEHGILYVEYNNKTYSTKDYKLLLKDTICINVIDSYNSYNSLITTKVIIE